MKFLFHFFICVLLFINVSSAQILDPVMAPFYHGVASGDALSDQVIIWTRISTESAGDITVSWEVATDEELNNVVQSGIATTNEFSDYTVKVDVTGLQPDTWYYFQFTHEGRVSLTGRTKTLPVGSTDRVRLAVASCARYGGGDYYNSYADIADRNDIQAVVHLGDYIYEGSGTVSGRGIQVLPQHETVTLEDYRQRYSTYRLDPDLRRAHQRYPFYTVWDDHETANDSWVNGAEGHDENTQGLWADRKAAGQQAYFEWLPIRPKAPGSYSIYRSFSIGDLVDLIMIDSRLEGRDEHADPGNTAQQKDTSRTLLGKPQMEWLKNELSQSQAKWKVIGNQVMFAPLQFLGFSSYDQWDGYQADRNRIISHVVDSNINNVVVITGDIHTSWANDVLQEGVSYNPNTGAGSAFVEFITPSILTGSPFNDNALATAIKLANNHIKYVDLFQIGYFILDLDSGRAQSDWYHVSTVKDASFTVSQSASWQVKNQERYLRESPGTAPAFLNTAPMPPLSVDNPPVGINPVETSAFAVQAIYPNPASDKVIIEYYADEAATVQVKIFDMVGKERILSLTEKSGIGQHKIELDVSNLNPGYYLLHLYKGGQSTGTGQLMVYE